MSGFRRGATSEGRCIGGWCLDSGLGGPCSAAARGCSYLAGGSALQTTSPSKQVILPTLARFPMAGPPGALSPRTTACNPSVATFWGSTRRGVPMLASLASKEMPFLLDFPALGYFCEAFLCPCSGKSRATSKISPFPRQRLLQGVLLSNLAVLLGESACALALRFFAVGLGRLLKVIITCSILKAV